MEPTCCKLLIELINRFSVATTPRRTTAIDCPWHPASPSKSRGCVSTASSTSTETYPHPRVQMRLVSATRSWCPRENTKGGSLNKSCLDMLEQACPSLSRALGADNMLPFRLQRTTQWRRNTPPPKKKKSLMFDNSALKVSGGQ